MSDELITRLHQRAEYVATVDPLYSDQATSALLREAANELERVRAALLDPISVFANMLRGSIAKPSVAALVDLYGAEAFRDYLKPPSIDQARLGEPGAAE